MTRWLMGTLAVGMLAGCGDLKFDENLPTSPGGSVPGATTSWGSMSVIVDNETVTAPLPTGAIWRNGSFGFAALNAAGISRTFTLSVRMPGPGTYVVGGPNTPTVSLIEQDGSTSNRWTTTPKGAGSVTVSFLSDDAASGYFSVELLPDSATAAAGYTARRYMTNGSFSVNISR